MKIGALTIGQSPRVDVTPEFLAAFGSSGCGAASQVPTESQGRMARETGEPDVVLVQRGLLDGLSAEQIAGLAPRPGDAVLVSRLRDGSEVELSEERVHGGMQDCVHHLEEEGVGLIVLFCTGEFPDLRSRLPLLRPDRLVAHFVSAIAPGELLAAPRNAGKISRAYRVCTVVPSALQTLTMREKWERWGFDVRIIALSPYTSTRNDWVRSAKEAAATDCDLVVLDCIGYSGAVRSVFRELGGKPVVLPRTLLGRAAAELAGR